MDLKKFRFACPHCNTTLNDGELIALTTVRENGDTGTIHLSTTFGNYTYRHVPETNFDKGEIVDFLCPSCNANLETKKYENYALLKMEVDNANDIGFEIIFSREAGKRKTYVITEDGIETYRG